MVLIGLKGDSTDVQSPSAMILETKKIKSATLSIVSPSICYEVMGPGALIFIFLNAEF